VFRGPAANCLTLIKRAFALCIATYPSADSNEVDNQNEQPKSEDRESKDSPVFVS